MEGLTISQFVRVMLRILATTSHDWSEGEGQPKVAKKLKGSGDAVSKTVDDAYLQQLRNQLK